MAYRFTDTEKWSDSWFVDLKPTEKLLFLYAADVCDVAGFMEISVRKICFDLGLTEKGFKGALKGLQRGFILSDDGEVLYLKNFIKNQKNIPLNPANKAHKGIIRRFEKYADRFDLEILSGAVGIDLFTLLKIDLEEYKKERGSKGALKPLVRGTGIGIGISNIVIDNKAIIKGVVGGNPEPEDVPEVEVEEMSPFGDFVGWIAVNAPQVAKMKEPFTEDEFNRLFAEYYPEDIYRTLGAMHNYKPLLTKSVSANLTVRNWLRRDKVRKINEGAPQMGGSSKSKVSQAMNAFNEAFKD